MNCPNCGNPVPDQAKFCTKCGHKIAPPTASALPVCPKCGYQAEHPSKFCMRCGAPMEGGAPAAHVEPPKAAPTGSGAPVHSEQSYYAPPIRESEASILLGNLCGKLNVARILLLISAIIAACLCALCLILSIINFANLGRVDYYITGPYSLAVSSYSAGTAIGLLISAAMIAVGMIVNFLYFSKTTKYLNQIRSNPVGIVDHFTHTGVGGLLAINIIFGGNVLGIIGAAFNISAKNTVMRNIEAFQMMERNPR